MRRRWRELLLLAASSSISLAALLAFILIVPTPHRDDLSLEGDTTFHDNIHGPNTRFDAEIGWTTRESSSITGCRHSRFSSNALGLRNDAEVDPSRDAVLLLGDSVLYGHCVDDRDTFAHRMQAAFPHVQILNGGVSGFGLDQMLLLYRRLAPSIRLRAIVLVLLSNDYQETLVNTAWGKAKPLFKIVDGRLELTNSPVSKYSCQNLTSRSWLLNLYPPLREWFHGFCRTERSDDSVMDLLMGEFVREARSRGVPLVAVMTPFAVDFAAETPGSAQYRQLAERHGIPILDLRTELPKVTTDWSRIFLDPCHYSPEGHEAVARIATPFLRELLHPAAD